MIIDVDDAYHRAKKSDTQLTVIDDMENGV